MLDAQITRSLISQFRERAERLAQLQLEVAQENSVLLMELSLLIDLFFAELVVLDAK